MWRNRHTFTFVTVLLVASLVAVNALPASNKRKVCVIGAGAAGLVSAKQLADYPDDFDIVVFEKNSDVGGLWIYTNSTDLDEHGLPVHSSVYKNVRTNSAKEIMAFPDYYHFGGENRSSVAYYTVLSYLGNYTEHFNLRQYIQFNTLVKKVTPKVGKGDWKCSKYEIETFDFDTYETSKTTCNALMICNGHNFEPRMPVIRGIETFPGKTLHSHVYRIPEAFTGQTVAVLGAGASGVDISIDLSEHAKKIYLSHNHDKITVPLPSNIEQISGIVAADGKTLILKDGKNVTDAEAVIYSTGYIYTFPFLGEKSGIVVDDNQVQYVYKHVINIKHPLMAFIGLFNGVTHNLAFYTQTKYFVSLLKGNFELPSEQEMLKDFERTVQNVPKRQTHSIDMGQWVYYDELAKIAQFEPLPRFYEKGARMWRNHYRADPWHYKEKNLVILENGDVELVDTNEPIVN